MKKHSFEKTVFSELSIGDSFHVYDPITYTDYSRNRLIRFTKIKPSKRSYSRPFVCNTTSNSSNDVRRGYFLDDTVVWKCVSTEVGEESNNESSILQ